MAVAWYAVIGICLPVLAAGQSQGKGPRLWVDELKELSHADKKAVSEIAGALKIHRRELGHEFTLLTVVAKSGPGAHVLSELSLMRDPDGGVKLEARYREPGKESGSGRVEKGFCVNCTNDVETAEWTAWHVLADLVDRTVLEPDTGIDIYRKIKILDCEARASKLLLTLDSTRYKGIDRELKYEIGSEWQSYYVGHELFLSPTNIHKAKPDGAPISVEFQYHQKRTREKCDCIGSGKVERCFAELLRARLSIPPNTSLEDVPPSIGSRRLNDSGISNRPSTFDK